MIGAPNFASIARATGEIIGRVSALLYFVVEESLVLPVPVAAWLECAVLPATRSSRAISQVAQWFHFGDSPRLTPLAVGKPALKRPIHEVLT